MNRLLLIDASGFLFRAFYGIPPTSRSDGAAVNAIKGYCELLWWLTQRTDYTHIAIAADAGHSGRKDIDPSYKGNRPEKPADLVTQLSMLPAASAAFAIPTVRVPGCEADDVMASFARIGQQQGFETEIYSGDKDMLQLIGDGVSVYDPLKRQQVTADVCHQRFGVWPEQMIDYQSLVGDSADNVKGVPGVGAKTAAAVLSAHGTLDEILDVVNARPHEFQGTRRIAESICLNQRAALTARQLVTLQQDVGPLPEIETLRRIDFDPDLLIAYLREMEFNLLAMTIQDRLGMAA